MIDLSKLSRNYKEKPLKYGEEVPKEDLYYLFIECNLSTSNISEIIGRNSEWIRKKLKTLGIKKDIKAIRESANTTYKQNTGYDNAMQNPEVLQKMKNNYKDKTGYDHPMHNPDCYCNFRENNPMKDKSILETRKQNCLDKTGKEWYVQTEEFKEKASKTLKDKTGYDNAMQNPDVLQLRKELQQEKHGVDHPMQRAEVLENYQTSILRIYGKDNIQKVPEKYAQTLNTKIEKYGDTRMFGTLSFYEKADETKSKKGTHSSSKPEEQLFELLKNKFGENDVKRNYKNKECYPFKCDFYIISLDLYIEYQGDRGHGEHPFDINDPEDVALKEYWEKKAEEINYKGNKKERYAKFVRTWTVRDPLKRETAKKNNLNWIEFFSVIDFIVWYNTLS